MAASPIRWGLVVLAGFLMEVAIFVVVLPILYAFGERAFVLSVAPTALVMTFLFGIWVGRKVETRPVLHGVLVGAIGTLMYLALNLAAPEPPLYLLAHALKVVGGAGGGFIGSRRSKAVPATL